MFKTFLFSFESKRGTKYLGELLRFSSINLLWIFSSLEDRWKGKMIFRWKEPFLFRCRTSKFCQSIDWLSFSPLSLSQSLRTLFEKDSFRVRTSNEKEENLGQWFVRCSSSWSDELKSSLNSSDNEEKKEDTDEPIRRFERCSMRRNDVFEWIESDQIKGFQPRWTSEPSTRSDEHDKDKEKVEWRWSDQSIDHWRICQE